MPLLEQANVTFPSNLRGLEPHGPLECPAKPGLRHPHMDYLTPWTGCLQELQTIWTRFHFPADPRATYFPVSAATQPILHDCHDPCFNRNADVSQLGETKKCQGIPDRITYRQMHLLAHIWNLSIGS